MFLLDRAITQVPGVEIMANDNVTEAERKAMDFKLWGTVLFRTRCMPL
jgi:hypothetical protein